MTKQNMINAGNTISPASEDLKSLDDIIWTYSGAARPTSDDEKIDLIKLCCKELEKPFKC